MLFINLKKNYENIEIQRAFTLIVKMIYLKNFNDELNLEIISKFKYNFVIKSNEFQFFSS